jgi:TonB family protein
MIMTMPDQPARRARPRPKLRRAEADAKVTLHLPPVQGPGGFDLGLAGAILFAAGVVFYLIARFPPHAAPREETVEWVEEIPPPPVEVKEPPKVLPPPVERPAPRVANTEPPPPVFGLQEDETSEQGDMAVATGNTLAARPYSIVQKAPALLPPAPVELDRAPGFLKQAMAEYPGWAQDQGVEAVVLVWVTIDAEGRVTDASIKRAAGKDFDAGALRAARASLFQPLVKDGSKVPSRFVVTYNFKLEG